MGFRKKKQLPAISDRIYPHDGAPEVGAITNAQGLQLTTYCWRVKEPRAGVMLVHGVQTHARFEFLRHLQPEEEELPLPSVPQRASPQARGGESSNMTPGTSQPSIDTTSVSTACKGYTRWCIYEKSWVQQLNDAGCSVYAVDLQSFGHSQGWKDRRCSVERLDHLASDVVCFAEHVAADLHKQLESQPDAAAVPPLYLVGISMGGFSVIRSLELMGKANHWLLRAAGGSGQDAAPADRRPRLIGCVALAPMLSAEKASAGAFNKVAAKMGSTFSRLTPHMGIAKLPAARLRWIDEQKNEDPLVTSPMKLPCRMAVEVLEALPRVHEEAKFIPAGLKFMIIHAEQDTLVEPAGSKRFHEESAQHISNRELKLLQGDRGHYLVIEPENEDVMAAIKAFIQI
ncbi:hypothetical protein ACSSS7_004431 [Eimeria intestinalis]